MKKSRFTEEQMVTMLREADTTSVAEVSKKYGVTTGGVAMSGRRPMPEIYMALFPER